MTMIVAGRSCCRTLKWCQQHRDVRELRCISRNLYSTQSTPLSETIDRPSQSSNSFPRSLYFDTIAPNANQSQAASHFFQIHRPHKSWVANEWRKQAYSNTTSTSSNGIRESPTSASTLLTPEIAFLGRSNTGKSSLLNALLHSPDLCRVGSKPGKTTTMHAWTLSATASSSSSALPTTSSAGRKGKDKDKSKSRIETSIDDRLTVLDMPGYGHGSRDEWGTDIVKYLTRRRQLRRAIVLLNPKHGLKESDRQILDLLRTHGIPHQIVACKCDMLPASELEGRLLEIRTAIQRRKGHWGSSSSAAAENSLCIDDILVVGRLDSRSGKTATKVNAKTAFGVDEVRWMILKAVGLDAFAIESWTKQKQTKIKVSNPSHFDI